MSMPTGLRGFLDDAVFDNIDGFASAVDYILEQVPELHHPESVRVYSAMRHEAHLSSILQAYARSVGNARYAVDPAGCRDEVVEQTADDLGLPIKGYSDEPDPADPEAKVMRQTGARRRRFTWGEHVRLSGMDRTYGHAFFEQAWAEQGGRWRLEVVQERMPQTVQALKLNKDGTLAGVQQGPVTGTQLQGVITTADHRLVYYVRDRQGSNYFGESLLRPAYGPWLIKHQLMRVHATSIRRFGMGIPTAQALPGTSPTPQEIAGAQRVVSQLKAGEFSGVAMPAGFRLAVEGMTGSVPDALAFIVYLDRLCTRSTLTSILDMAVAERGNRSLGETVMALMVMAQQDDAQRRCDVATQQIVVPLVDANWGDSEPAPQVCVSNVGTDPELTAEDVNWLLEYGGIRADQPFRAWLRARHSIPAEDPNDPVNQPAPTDQPGGAQ